MTGEVTCREVCVAKVFATKSCALRLNFVEIRCVNLHYTSRSINYLTPLPYDRIIEFPDTPCKSRLLNPIFLKGYLWISSIDPLYFSKELLKGSRYKLS